MNLVDLQNVSRSAHAILNHLGKDNGVIGAYHNPAHFDVLPIDYERLAQENHPVKEWSCRGHRPNVSHKFARYGKGLDNITVSATFDYSKEF